MNDINITVNNFTKFLIISTRSPGKIFRASLHPLFSGDNMKSILKFNFLKLSVTFYADFLNLKSYLLKKYNAY